MPIKKEVKAESSMIECEVMRRIGMTDGMAEVGDIVNLDKKDAKKLADAGAVKVVIK